MKLVHEVLSEITQTFRNHQFSDPKRQAEDVLCEFLRCSRAQLYSSLNRSLSKQEGDALACWMHRRLQGEPLAYLSGKVEFYGCLIEVNRHVLIPRPETEILVDKIAASLRRRDLQGKILWDMCSGSGCIGIALKKALPALTVYLADCSEPALALARRNATANEVEVICLQGDLFSPFHGQKTHYFVCNPPYISENEYMRLDKEVRDYEPRLALMPGRTGLEFYERLARELPSYLYPLGQAWLEIGYQQGEAVLELFQGFPWKRRDVENDWAGHHRFFFLENE